MTESAFIALHTVSGTLNISNRINVNYNPTPTVDNPQAGTITGVTVALNALSVAGVSNVSIEYLLEQVENIRFIFDSVNYSLNIVNRTFYNTSIPFYYFQVEPAIVPNINDASLGSSQDSTVINFTPFILDIQFAFSNYNVLLNNAEENRRSARIVQSDRLTTAFLNNRTTTLPSNWESIISGSATLASIQDSLYSDTGWTNARYNGSTTTADNFSGISPALSGRSFNGEIFPNTSNAAYICSIATGDRVIQELYFANHHATVPGFFTSSLGITLASNFQSGSTSFTYNGTLLDTINRGDILKIQNECVRALIHDYTNRSVTVIRGYLESVQVNHNTGTPIRVIDRADIFRFVSNARVRAVENSNIYVEGNNSVVFTDKYGTVYSSSYCP